jgi:hypothetical protein
MVAALVSMVAAEALAKRTNVILIVADDLGWGDLGCYATPDLDTPVLGCNCIPTALAACSIRAVDGSKPLDGVDLLPLLTSDTAADLADRRLCFQ